MKKLILILFLIILIFLVSCAKVPEEKPQKKLDDLQITACEEADKAGTCYSRLIEIGIVMPNECCEILRKCC